MTRYSIWLRQKMNEWAASGRRGKEIEQERESGWGAHAPNYDEAESMAAHDAGATTQVEIEEGEGPVDPFIHRPGEKLPNGATIVACRRKESSPAYYFVLAMWLRGRNDCEYVTWASDLAGECYWGHYHGDDIQAAVLDYVQRPGEVWG